MRSVISGYTGTASHRPRTRTAESASCIAFPGFPSARRPQWRQASWKRKTDPADLPVPENPLRPAPGMRHRARRALIECCICCHKISFFPASECHQTAGALPYDLRKPFVIPVYNYRFCRCKQLLFARTDILQTMHAPRRRCGRFQCW
mgnify:CR=1 FL=1